MATVDLSTLPVKPTSFGRWQQLNGPLGLQAFGMNAIVCDPGEEFDIAHDESETGHQEAYVVVSGRAVFTIGDDRIEAGPGTVVSAPAPGGEPRLRGARAGHPPRLHRSGAGLAAPLRRVDRRGRPGRALTV